VNESLDRMQNIVAQYFADIRLDSLEESNNDIYNNINTKELAYTRKERGKIIWFEKKSETKTVYVIFILPEIISKNNIKPLDYITYLLKYSGEGSLFSHLKNLKYAIKLDAGVMASYKTFSLFVVSIDITNEGFKNLKEIITELFKYINLMKNTPVNSELYKELSSIANTQFK